MAAYAALVTLLNLIQDMHIHPRLSTSFDKKQIESLTEKLHFLLNLIETYNSRIEAGDLEMRIASAAQEAEDVIESHIVDRILAASPKDGPQSSNFSLNLQKKLRALGRKVQSRDAKSRLQRVMKEMDSIKEKMAKIEIKSGFRDESVLSTSSRPLITSRKSTMVGFDEELIQLMDVLTSQKSVVKSSQSSPWEELVRLLQLKMLSRIHLLRFDRVFSGLQRHEQQLRFGSPNLPLFCYLHGS